MIIQERHQLDWKKAWVNTFINNTITNLLQKLMELGAMSVADFQELVEQKIKEDQKINQELNKIEEDVLKKERIETIANQITSFLLSVPDGKIDFHNKGKNETKESYIKKHLKVQAIVEKHINNTIHQKFLKEVKDYTQEQIVN